MRRNHLDHPYHDGNLAPNGYLSTLIHSDAYLDCIGLWPTKGMIGLDSPSISSTPILTSHPSQTHTLTQSTTLVTTVLVSQLFFVTPGDILIVYKATVKKTIFVLISKFQWLSIQYVRLVRDLCEYSPQILDKCTVRSLIAVQVKTSIDLFFQNTCFSSLCEYSPQILD